MRLEDLALIGNCQCSALVDRTGSIVWCCLPRFDSEPVFASLLDQGEGGRFLAGPAAGGSGTQRYLDNTNIVETVFADDSGRFRVVDFLPRFNERDGIRRPAQLVRILEPLEGTPRVRVSCEPRLGWSKTPATRSHGSNHIAFGGFERPVRLTTDIPLSYIGGAPFTLSQRRHMVLAWDAPVEEALAPLCEHYLGETTRYWRRWVKHCNVPHFWQRQVIRSALALKLHCFEDSGGIVAAMTTSIPEAGGTGGTSDYRCCFLRDAHKAVRAFALLGHFEEREQLLRYLLGVIAGSSGLDLMSAYRIDGTSGLDERELLNWPGFEGNGPVRVGNRGAAKAHTDAFGELVLALAPIYLDERFSGERSQSTLELLESVTRRAIAAAAERDVRSGELGTPRTLSSAMCWAAADCMAQVAARYAPALEREFRAAASAIRSDLFERAWSDHLGTFVSRSGGRELDPSLLQMARLRLLTTDDQRLRRTVAAIRANLSEDGWRFRHHRDDGSAQPETAFIPCTFWLVEALAAVGHMGEAVQVMKQAHDALSPVGLLSEYHEAQSQRAWGNFPRAHSHAAFIHAAFAASPRWEDVV